MPFSIRDYRPDDFSTLWQIDQGCFAPGLAYSQWELRSYLRRPKVFALVAERGENSSASVAGFVVAEAARQTGHIITIDVRAEARRHKVGSSLLAVAEARLRAAQCAIVRLETAVDNSSALAFYKRHGYDVVKTIPRYYSNGVDALLLEKDLLPALHSAELLK